MDMKEIINRELNDFVHMRLRKEARKTKLRCSLTLLEWKYRWFTEHIFHIETGGDVELSIEFGKTIVEVMNVIRDNRNQDYIEDRSNYVKFMIVCNMLRHREYIDWVICESIRNCWFEYCAVDDCGNAPSFIKCPGEEDVEWSVEVVDYLLDEFFKEKVKGE